jgi:hypothetical protein
VKLDQLVKQGLLVKLDQQVKQGQLVKLVPLVKLGLLVKLGPLVLRDQQVPMDKRPAEPSIWILPLILTFQASTSH